MVWEQYATCGQKCLHGNSEWISFSSGAHIFHESCTGSGNVLHLPLFSSCLGQGLAHPTSVSSLRDTATINMTVPGTGGDL